jgi:hypothetical protein
MNTKVIHFISGRLHSPPAKSLPEVSIRIRTGAERQHQHANQIMTLMKVIAFTLLSPLQVQFDLTVRPLGQLLNFGTIGQHGQICSLPERLD